MSEQQYQLILSFGSVDCFVFESASAHSLGDDAAAFVTDPIDYCEQEAADSTEFQEILETYHSHGNPNAQLSLIEEA